MSPARPLQVFATVFAVVFALVYVIAVEKNYAFFTYHPVTYTFGLWVQPPGEGPAMYWFGWMTTAALAGGGAGLLACLLPQGLKLHPGLGDGKSTTDNRGDSSHVTERT